MLAADSLPSVTRVRLPQRYRIEVGDAAFRVTQLLETERDSDVELAAFKSRGANCRRVLGTFPDETKVVIEFAAFRDDYPDEIAAVVRMRHPVIEGGLLRCLRADYREAGGSLEEAAEQAEVVRKAWHQGIQYRTESTVDGLTTPGLREPQVGALHAIAAHWTLSSDPALVVMPTGTGKTEVMMASAVGTRCERLLVVVPSDALRQQTARKFGRYGVLQSIGVIDAMPYPVVGVLSSEPTRDHLEAMQSCNVVVATMASIGRAPEDVQRAIAAAFSHVYFDEAHHIQATSWKRFQQQCDGARTLLLTATPFREDGKPLEGRIIYDYPLSASLERGYFQPLSFVEVFEPDSERADREIAAAAVGRLREDLAAGYDHILMARAQNIQQAEALHDGVYAAEYADLNPVLIHSQSPGKQARLNAIIQGEHKIVVCVNMFGEGFDLPTLKVAALHSIHKSLGVTLQFIGRFARTGGNVGRASFVANTAEDGVPESLESLYQDDPDWNLLLPDLSYDAINPQSRLSDLVANLRSVGDDGDLEISMLALRPKCSAHAYRTADFHPERYCDAFTASQRVYQPQVSRQDRMLVLIVNQEDRIDWTDSRDISIDSWDLYVAYFDADRGMLYIHSSRKGDSGERLAKAVSTDPVMVAGEETFKVFGGLRRLTLHSVGLSSLSRNVRFQMFAGLDVRNAVDPVQQRSKRKSVITGVGYEEGNRQSVGCSRKGKLWSMRSGSLSEWRDWCDGIGAKLCDPDRDPDDFLRYTLIPTSVANLPDVEAVMADWPDQLFEAMHFRFEVRTETESFGFDECQVDLASWTPGGTGFEFTLQAGEDRVVRLQLELVRDGEEESYTVTRVDGDVLQVHAFGRTVLVEEFFAANPPLVRLQDGSQLSGNILLKPREDVVDAFDRNRLRTIDWEGVDLTKESMWRGGQVRADSIQHRFIRHLEQTDATFIIDDDDAGESADIVAIEEQADRIVVHLWHCKYASGVEPGHRVRDLFEVCGQAQKSVKWTWNLRRLITHLITRETKHKRGRETRFVRGTLHGLATLRKSSRRKFVEYSVGIVQPGLSASGVSDDQLSILGATNSFVQVVTDRPLAVIVSA